MDGAGVGGLLKDAGRHLAGGGRQVQAGRQP